MAKRVLVVDDDNSVRTLLSALLQRAGCQHDLAIDGQQAIVRLRRFTYDAILLDLMMPVTNGFEVLHFLGAEKPDLLSRVIIVTAASHLTLRDFDTSRVHALVRKPFDVSRLLEIVADCCNRTDSVEQVPLGGPPPETLDA